MPRAELKLPRHRLQQIQRFDDAIPSEAQLVPEHQAAILVRSGGSGQLRANRATFDVFAISRPTA